MGQLYLYLYGVKYQPSLNNETNYWKIWAVKHETHCFVLLQFYVVLCRGCAKENAVSHMGLRGNCEGGWLLYFRGETDISYISSLIALHYNTSCVFYVWTSAERRENVWRKWQGRFWRLYTFQYTQHSHPNHTGGKTKKRKKKQKKKLFFFWGKIVSNEGNVITFTLLVLGI